MSWRTLVSWQLRRRAVVGGRMVDAAGERVAGCARVVLNPKTQRAPIECHARRDGSFFFLDVPSGKYSLEGFDDSGKAIRQRDIVVKPYETDTRMPVVQVDLEVAARQAKPERN
jgi:hypothetical protein